MGRCAGTGRRPAGGHPAAPAPPRAGDPRRSGFTLVVVAVLLLVGSMVLVATLPRTRGAVLKGADTVEKLDRVERALTGFMATSGRLPCPASGSAPPGTAAFGVETDATGDGLCTGAPLGPDASGHVVAGAIPTRALHLDDSFAVDAWGRRITYVVDRRATAAASCLTLENYPTLNGTGGIAIKSSAGGATIANVMHAFLIHGPSGFGAFPAQGSSVANRINTGTADADMLANAGVSSAATDLTATAFGGALVQKDRTASFDQVVYYPDYHKNVCCVGPLCSSGTGCTLSSDQGGGTLADGGSMGAYSASSGATCPAANTLACSGGTLSCTLSGGGSGTVGTDCRYAHCSKTCGLTANQGGGTLNGAAPGNTATEYTSNSDTSCTAHTLTCTDGTLSCATGNLSDCAYGSCALACTLTANQGGGMLASGNTKQTYVSASDASCTAHTLACTNGTLTCDGGADQTNCTYASCNLSCGLTANQGGGSLSSGGTATEYVAANDATCTAHTLTCSGGALTCDGSGTLTNCQYNSCAQTCALSANQGGGTLNNGGTATEYAAASDPTCTPHTLTCTGTASSNSLSCATGTPGDCSYSSCTVTPAGYLSGFRADGTTAGDDSGYSVAAGDINNDGVKDLIISAPFANGNVGSVYVVFGTSSGFPNPLPLSSLNGSNGFRLDSPAGEGIGRETGLAVADVNGDGKADLIISAYGGGYNGLAQSGSVYVVYGGATMKSGTAWTTCPCTLTASGSVINGTNGFRLDGEQAGEQAGWSVAAGDVDGDGKADIIIGAMTWAASSQKPQAGAVYVVFGSQVPATATQQLQVTCSVHGCTPWLNGSGSHGFRLEGSNAYEGVGQYLGTGDINGDGKADIIVNSASASTYGSTYVIYGGATEKSGTAWPATQAISSLTLPTNGFRLDGTNAPSTGTFGDTGPIATGDVNGDGKTDIVIGSPNAYSATNGPQQGRAYVVFGGSTRKDGTAWAASNPLASTGTTINGTNGFRLDGENAGDIAGNSVAVGDINKDGYADVVIGASYANSYAGYTYVVFGKAGAWAATNSLAANGTVIDGTHGFRLDGATSDQSGQSVAAGDVNGDGYADIIVCDFQANSAAGSTYTVFGQSCAYQATSSLGTVVSAPNACPVTCTLPWGGTINSGQTATAYQAATVNAPASCVSETRTCQSSGTLSGSYTNQGCTVLAQCTLAANQGGGALASGGSMNAYSTNSAATCPSANTLSCTNGTLSCSLTDGSTGVVATDCAYSSCTPTSCTLTANQGGGTLAGGNTATEYTSSSDATCPAHTLTCTTGVLTCSTGDLNDCAYASCSIAAAGLPGFRLDGVAGVNGNPPNGDEIGTAVAAGDVNGDGIQDLVIGAWPASPGGQTSAGSVFVVFGKATGWSSPLSLSTLDGSNGFRLDGVTANDELGEGVAVGDVNGDGKADLVLGAPAASYSAAAAGSVYVVFGGATRKDGTAWSSCPCTLTTTFLNGGGTAVNGFRLDGVTANDNTGLFLFAGGDLNGDGRADLLVGVPGASGTAGKEYVVFGGATKKDGSAWAVTNGLGALANGTNGALFTGQIWTGNSFNIGREAAVSGDVNGDGKADLIIGEGAYNSSCSGHGCTATWTGAVFVIYGKAAGWAASTTLTAGVAPLDGSNGFLLLGAPNDQIGVGVAAGDLDGRVNGSNKIDDILIVADPSNTPTILAVFGGANGKMKDGTTAWAASNTLSSGGAVINGSNGFRIDGSASDGGIGSSSRLITTADVNGDGKDDILLGDMFASYSAADAGSVYAVFGGATKKDGTAWAATQTLSSVANGTNGFRLDGINANDEAGQMMTGGAINGDGKADIIVGVPTASPSSGTLGNYAGSVYVAFGQACNWQATQGLGSLSPSAAVCGP